jgi:hypothetical protein
MPTHAILDETGKLTTGQIPSGMTSLTEVKADEQIASTITNTHASGSDNQDLSNLMTQSQILARGLGC